jgi:eukaryotic-like serine/threonine-protein kinase
VNSPRFTLSNESNHEIEAQLARFEQDRVAGPLSLDDYTPPRDHPAYAAVVTELARIDLEHRSNENDWEQGEKYLGIYPEVFSDNHYRTQLAFEEYRLRRWAGQSVPSEEIAKRYNVDSSRWPNLEARSGPSEKDHRHASLSFDAKSLIPPIVKYPRIGDTFAGYLLVDRLGEGAFSRVFIARQPDLAGRLVVLKITPLSTDESDKLARLQHSAIIPVYSVHREENLSGICMPFLGSTTLADLASLSAHGTKRDGTAEELVSTILDRRRSTIATPAPHLALKDDSRTTTLSAELSEMPSPFPVGLERFTGLTYVNAIVTLISNTMEGLWHAHQRGVVHRDLKPANILIDDDGNPVILDFNLAVESYEPRTRVVGGTLPYMSPQQLEALTSGAPADGRDDIFSMGVILYELLAGRLPFESPKPGESFELDRVIEERRQPFQPVRNYNRGVTPGLQAIVHRCLEPNRKDRYQQANELLEDLRCHQQHRPLMIASDRSFRERLAKWALRHPRLSSATSMASVALICLTLLGLLTYRRGEQIARLDLKSKFNQFRAELPIAITSLSTPGLEKEILEQGLESSLLIVDAWINEESTELKPDTLLLDNDDQSEMRPQLAQLLYLMADAETAISRQIATSEKTAHQTNAFRWNRLCSKIYPQLKPLADQQRLRMAGTPRNAWNRPELNDSVNQYPIDLRTLAAAKHGDATRLHQLARLQLQNQPSNVSLWFYLAIADARLGNWDKAISELDVCDQLQTKSIAILFNRGLANLQMRYAESARRDFTSCLMIDPSMVAARFNRAVANEKLRDFEAARADLDKIIASGQATTRMLLLRSRIHRQLGKLDAAHKDLDAATKLPPQDINDWVARGAQRVANEPKQALRDFQEALRIQPDHFEALQNTAHVYGDIENDAATAILYLDKLVKAYPTSALAAASRGIMRARLGSMELAMADANAAIKLEPSAREQLQIAGIYALALSHTSSTNVVDRNAFSEKAMKWLGKALRSDPSLTAIAINDSDLAALREDIAFRRLINSALTLDAFSK